MDFSLKDSYVVVNYHYVRDPSEKQQGINSCSVEEFDRQVKFLSGNFKIVSIPEVFGAAKNKLSGRFCSLTFDDCLKDVYVNAAPILKKYNSSATLFPITSVFKGRLPSVHKIHILLSEFSAEYLIDLFNGYLDKHYLDLGDKYKIPKDKRVMEHLRLDDDLLTANFKETLTIAPSGLKENFVDFCFKKVGLAEKRIRSQLFMNESEVKSCAIIGWMSEVIPITTAIFPI